MSDPSQSDAHTLMRASEIFEDLGDKRSAFKCVSIGAKLNHGPCQVLLGLMYVSGDGTRKNLKLAEYWNRQAYKNGEALGAFNLALSKARQGDRRSAIAWFRKAVADNYADALVELAKLYKDRSATKRHAIELLQRAVRLGPEELSVEVLEEAAKLLSELTSEKVGGRRSRVPSQIRRQPRAFGPIRK